MNAIITQGTNQTVKDINSLGDEIKNEFEKFVEIISKREPTSLSEQYIDETIENHYSIMDNVVEKFYDHSNSIDYSSGSEKMNELESILKEDLLWSFFDYTYYLQEYRIDLRLGMSTQVEALMKRIVNDFDRLNQWLLSV